MTPKILIVDDEPHIRLLIEQALETLEEDQVELMTASDGREALRIIEVEQPDLVFLDVMMPLMDGFEVCRIVKHTPSMRHVYIALLTAKGQELDREQGGLAGADSYITKPFDPDDLLDLAARVVGPPAT